MPRILPSSLSVGLGDVLAAIAGEGFCQTEIQHFYPALGCHFHIGWLQIAMDHPFFVGSFQCFRNLNGDLQCLLDSDRASLNSFRHVLPGTSSITR